MAEIVVQPVRTRRQRRHFLNLPWRLYRDDPHWIPPLRLDQKELVNYRPHPFYETNDIQTFVAYRSGTPCGRIAAILNRGHVERYGDPRGFFGFFECADDQEAAHGLFDAVRQWLAQRGIGKLRGPVNPSLNYTLGLLIDGFDSPPTFMMTYNPPYYERLVETYGMRKSQDLYAYWGNIDMLPPLMQRYRPVGEQIAERFGATVRSLDRTRFLEDVESFLSVYNRALVNTWGFVPMSRNEILHAAKGLRYLIVPELAVGVEVNGQLIGAVFALPDYNPRIKKINGRLFPFGFIRLLWGKQRIKRVRIISTNVIPEYQRMGFALLLMGGMIPKALEWGMEEAEFSWVLESNLLSRGSLEKGGAKRTKTYRVYDLDSLEEEPAR